jgi:hypothetical protein
MKLIRRQTSLSHGCLPCAGAIRAAASNSFERQPWWRFASASS